MPPVGFEPTISAGERPKTYALDRAATGTGIEELYWILFELKLEIWLLLLYQNRFCVGNFGRFPSLGGNFAEKTCLLRKSLSLQLRRSTAHHLLGGQFVTSLMSNYAQLYRDRTNKIIVLWCMHKTQLHFTPLPLSRFKHTEKADFPLCHSSQC